MQCVKDIAGRNCQAGPVVMTPAPAVLFFLHYWSASCTILLPAGGVCLCIGEASGIHTPPASSVLRGGTLGHAGRGLLFLIASCVGGPSYEVPRVIRQGTRGIFQRMPPPPHFL
jgi:hypothetical protein